jgi:hypothetical protein
MGLQRMIISFVVEDFDDGAAVAAWPAAQVAARDDQKQSIKYNDD